MIPDNPGMKEVWSEIRKVKNCVTELKTDMRWLKGILGAIGVAVILALVRGWLNGG